MTRAAFSGPRCLPLLLAIALAACASPTDNTQITDAAQLSLYGPPGTVTVTPKTAAIAPGATVQLTATVSGLATASVTWSSSNAAVATVSATGLVTGVASGTATIVAKSTVDPDKRAAASIAVRPPPVEVGVNPKTAALLPGATQQLTATVTGASNTAVTWSSTNTAVATVSSTGLVTAVSAGNASIIATSQANPERRGGAAITVRPLPIIEIKVNPATVAIVTGRTAQLKVEVRNTTNTAVMWSSSNPAVATVSSTGLVTAVAVGTATITATSQASADKKSSTAITVSALVPVTPSIGVKVTPERVEIAKGATAQLTVAVTGSTNTAVTWSSSNPAVATVSSTGLVTGVSAGSAMITATSVANADRRGAAGVTVKQ